MRIAHVTATFPPHLTGTGNVCFHNAHQLASRGHKVHVFTAVVQNSLPQENLNGITVHRIKPIIRVGNAPFLPQLYSLLKGFDIIHLHYPFLGGEVTTLAAKRTKTPLVITYHQDVLLHGWMSLVEKILRSTVGRWTLRAAKKILFTSQDYGEVSYIRPMLAGRENSIDELPNGVDTDRFSNIEPPAEMVKRYKTSPGDQVALLVAALDRAHYFKGVPVFLAALAQLPKNIKGVIVGDGDLRPSYMQQAAQLGLVDRVYFPGRIPDELLPAHYQLADVTVLPSLTMGEAFGLVLVESMACGTPVIATNLPGVRTVVDHGRDGYLVKVADSDDLQNRLGSILSLPVETRQAMGAAGRRKVEQKYAWHKIGQRLETIYQDVCSKSSSQKVSGSET